MAAKILFVTKEEASEIEALKVRWLFLSDHLTVTG
jgi:hypothetical protein